MRVAMRGGEGGNLGTSFGIPYVDVRGVVERLQTMLHSFSVSLTFFVPLKRAPAVP